MSDFEPGRPARSAARVALAYGLLAALWILGSDAVAEHLAGDLASSARMQTVKGLFFVGTTALLLYALVRGEMARLVAVGRELLRAQEMLQALFDQAPFGIAVSRGRNPLTANARFLEVFGFAADDRPTKETIAQRFAPSERDRLTDLNRRREAGEVGLASSYEATALRPDGSEFPVQLDMAMLDLVDGPATLSFVRDITVRRHALRALERSEARFRAIFADAPVAMLLTRDGRIIDANATCAERFAVAEPSELIGRAWAQIFAVPEQSDPDAAVAETRGEADLLGRRGEEWFPARVRWGTVELDDGPAKLCLIIDITEQTAALEAARTGERKLAALFNSTVEFLALLQVDGTIIGMNAAAAQYSGEEPTALTGRRVWDLPWPGMAEEHWHWLREAVAWASEGEFVRDVLELAHPARGPVAIDLCVQPLVDETGEVRELILEGRDITGVRSAQRQAERLAAGLREVVSIADRLLEHTDVDELCRAAVELAREQLGVERCSIYLRDDKVYRGTWGTDGEGRTCDERHRLATTDEWTPPGKLHSLDGVQHWRLIDPPGTGPGWTAVTPLRSHAGELGVMFNDTKLIGAPCEPEQQDLLSVLAGLLGGFIQQLRFRTELERVNRLLEGTFESLAETVLVVDPATLQIHLANRAAERMFGRPPESLIGGSAALLMAPDAAIAEMVERTSEALSADGAFSGETVMRHRDGTPLITQVHARTLAGTAADEPRLVIAIRDITAQRQAEDELRAATAKLAGIIEATPAALAVTDTELRVTVWNRAAEELFGWTADEVIGRPLPTLPPGGDEEVRRIHARLREGKLVRGAERVRLRRDGSLVQVLLSVAEVPGPDGQPAGYAGAYVDISGRKRLEQALRENRERLRASALERELIEAQQRREIAVEIHDGVGQELSLLKLHLAGLDNLLTGPGSKAALANCNATIDQVIGSLRGLVAELSPPMLYELGLGPALGWLCEQFSQTTPVSFEADLPNGLDPLPTPVAVLLFRVVRELMHNVVKHSQAEKATVHAQTRNNQVTLWVHDAGVGFDPAEIEGIGRAATGIGLFSIRERVAAVGGRVTVDSRPGVGTKVTVQLSLPAGA